MEIENLKQKLQSYSGLTLVIFSLIHLTGIIYAGINPDGFELYASFLHSNNFLPFIEILLSITFIIHISLTLNKVSKIRSGGNTALLRTKRSDFLGILSSRIQPLTGIILVVFLLIHLMQLRFPRPSDNLELASLRNNLQSFSMLFIYSLASISLFFHMVHGIESGHRSTGILSQSNSLKIRYFGRFVSLFLGLSFLIMTFYLRLN